MFYRSEENQGAIWMSTIQTATHSGVAKFSQSKGLFEGFTSVAESTLPTGGKPNLFFPHEFFSFEITGLTPSEAITLTITLPYGMIVEYWKYGPTIDNPTPHWYEIPVGSNNGDRTITIVLVDGGKGDDDLMSDGTIVDQGGPGYAYSVRSAAVGGYYLPINSLSILTPYLALVLLGGIITAFFAVRRRR